MTREEAVAVEELGARLRAARSAAGLTREAVALRMAITLRRYQLLESGRSNMTFATLVRIARGLGCDVWAVLGTGR